MPGQPRKPTKLHVLQGTYDASRHSARANEAETGPIGDAPSWFGAIARGEWDRIMGNEVCRQMVLFSDRADFEHYCVLYERFVLDAKGERNMGASERQAAAQRRRNR
jgi:phage terminase small subunit